MPGDGERKVVDLMKALEEAVERAKNDREIRAAGFHGYEGCPESDCPSPFLCSEKGDCHIDGTPSSDSVKGKE